MGIKVKLLCCVWFHLVSTFSFLEFKKCVFLSIFSNTSKQATFLMCATVLKEGMRSMTKHIDRFHCSIVASIARRSDAVQNVFIYVRVL